MSDTVQRNNDFYVVGGTMKPDAPSYIERKADNELYERTLACDFCYVLTPRQMGKSSLMARTAHRLKNQGIRTVIVDLSQIGSEKKMESADQWYCGIAYRVAEELGIETDIGKWWDERKHLPALMRLTKFFRDVVLKNDNERVVIFVDEIDTTITLPFTDDFFAAIRACYNARATEPVYGRLSFVLLGVATPSQLTKDTRRTPFNIGHRIELKDFTSEEALPLASSLGKDQRKSEEALKRILYWTGGHPYLTQKLCCLAVDEELDIYSNEYIDSLVKKHFLAPDVSHQDDNLNFVRDRLVHKEKPDRRLLKLYRRILQGSPITDEPLSFIHTALKLSGIVVPLANRKLNVRNRIYEKTFTTDWLNEILPTNWNRNIAIALITVIIVLIIVYRVTLPLEAKYIATLRGARDKVPISEYNKLREIPGYFEKANDLFAEYWDRCALRAEKKNKCDERVLLYRLKSLKLKDTEKRRREVARCINGCYENLITTYRHNDGVNAVAFSPDGSTLLTACRDGTARLWLVDTGKTVGKHRKHESGVSAVAFSPKGLTVLTGSWDNTARLWLAETGEPLGKPMKHGSSVNSVSFSPDGSTVLTGSKDNTARLWRAVNGEPMGKIMKHNSSVSAVSFSPKGLTVLTGCDDNTARLWLAETGEPVGKPMKHGSSVNSVSFSPDGRTVLTGSSDKTARLWQAANGKPVGKIMRHKALVNAVSFSPNGCIVLTGSLDNKARLWRAKTGEPVGKIMRHNYWISSVTFSPDGRTVLTGSLDKTARSWRTDTSEYAEEPNIHEPIKGAPDELLEEWQKKLALKLNEKSGKIEPMYPIEVPKEPERN